MKFSGIVQVSPVTVPYEFHHHRTNSSVSACANVNFLKPLYLSSYWTDFAQICRVVVD